MDKFRKFAQDPYYAGILEVKKQVNTRCEIGLHETMLTLEEHLTLVQLFSGKKTKRRDQKQYNPEFPLNNLLFHECQEEAKMTGSIKNNGHGGYYPKYHCRKCSKQYKRDSIHEEVTTFLAKVEYNNQQRESWHQLNLSSLQIYNYQKRLTNKS